MSQHRRRRHHLWATSALLVVLAAGACSSGDEPVTLVTGGGPSDVPVDDRTAAQDIVLSPLDVPGYEVSPERAPDAAIMQAAGNFQQCAGAAAAMGDEKRMAQSPGFRKGSGTGVSSLAVLAVDESQARTAIGDLRRQAMADCLTNLFKVVLQPDVRSPITSASTTTLNTPTVGDESVTWRTTLQLSGGAQRAYSDLTFIRTGRSVGSLFVYQVGSPFPADERERLVEAMAARMAVRG